MGEPVIYEPTHDNATNVHTQKVTQYQRLKKEASEV